MHWQDFPAYFDAFFSVVHAEPKSIPVLAIDGPSASGKGTLASTLAQRLGYHFLDSGAIYRVTALLASREGVAIAPENEAQLAQLAQSLAAQYRLHFEGDRIVISLDEQTEDISTAIRSEAVGAAASKISVFPAVREALLHLQQSFRRLPGLVADGRDMGTVVFKDAQLKVYLTASAEARAKRRFNQLATRGQSGIISSLLRDLQERDARDQSRSNAPLIAAQDALTLDNSALSIEESVDWVLSKWEHVLV